jgi:hypothetical protein
LGWHRWPAARTMVPLQRNEEDTMDSLGVSGVRTPWNKGKLVGQKAPLKIRDIWAIRVRLQIQGRVRDLALLDLGIDSKLRACDLVQLRVRDVCHGNHVTSRAVVMQKRRNALFSSR